MTTLVNAEILLWQARVRRAFVSIVGVGMFALKWRGVISADSVISAQVGARRALEYSALLTLLYLLWIQGQMLWLRGRGTRPVEIGRAHV